jgi:dTDP-4-dehydrorhamnose 3,5-epimerase
MTNIPNIEKTQFEGLLIIKPNIFEDERGYFYESFNSQSYAHLGINKNFVQDNQSLSNKGVLRGLHFQNPPYEQGKLIRVIKGSVIDIVVDIRKESKTFGKHFSIEISDKNKTCLYVPPGFAHGFITLQDETIFFYKCTNYYEKNSEGIIIWNDSELNINWGISNPIVSEKDSKGLSFLNFISLF